MKRLPVPTMPELVERGLAKVRVEKYGAKNDHERLVYTATPEGQAEIYAAMRHNAQMPAEPPVYRRPA